MLWSTFMVLVIIDLCASTAIVNSTSFNHLPEIICRTNSASLREAIDVHSLRSFLAFLAALDDPHNPHNAAYKAIFKNKDRFPNIKHQWRAISDLTPRWEGEAEPLFRCIYSESEARHVAPSIPNLWVDCGNRNSLGLKIVGTVVFVCPPFFSLPDADPVATPEQCPDVVNNKFVRSPRRPGFVTDKSKGITATMLIYYGCKANSTYRFTSVVEQENEILRRNNEATYNECTSNLFFQNLVWNECRKIPNVDLPPWTNPATLNASLVGNLTSNSDSADNNTANSTQTLADPQPLNSSGSLLQGISPDAVGTS